MLENMIGSGAQIRAARGFLGWSQQDLAQAAGLSVNAIRYWEKEHGRPIARVTNNNSEGLLAIRHVFARAGLMLSYDPPGVSAHPTAYDRWKTPPIYARWEKNWKEGSKPGQDRAAMAAWARTVSGDQSLTLAEGVDARAQLQHELTPGTPEWNRRYGGG